MVRFHARINSQGQVYFPQEIRAELSCRELEILGNAKAVVFYPKGTKATEVLRSLEVVIIELKHHEQLQADETQKKNQRRI